MDLETRLTLRIPPDSSWWAKSLRWSCGRPEWPPITLGIDYESSYDRLMREWRAAMWVGMTIPDAGPPFRVLDIS